MNAPCAEQEPVPKRSEKETFQWIMPLIISATLEKNGHTIYQILALCDS